MPERAQSYQNHRRFLPLWHFFVIPVLLINVFVVIKRAISGPTLTTGWDVLVALALFFGVFLSRLMPLIAQDRLIRLEERTRFGRVLPQDMREAGEGLTRSQYVALRFAPDEEVPELVRRIRAGELTSAADIKRAIKNWRADHLRV
jgi:hypothetical protein